MVIMPTANSRASNEVGHGCSLVIGGKILSGRSKGQNIGYIAEYLTAFGIDQGSGGGRRRGESDRRRTQCAAGPPAGSGLGPRHGANTNVVLRARDAQSPTRALCEGARGENGMK
jgi:hypothetical protein